MGVFDGTIKVKRVVPDPATDHKLSHSGSLSFESITKDTALAGTKGRHCDLVHGDHWHEVRGSEKSTIFSDQTITVRGNHKETLVGNCYQNIIGPHIVQNNTVRNETRLGKFHLVYGDNEQTSDNSSDYSVVANSMSFIFLFNLECDAIAKIEFAMVHVETKVLHFTGDLYDIQAVTECAIQAAAGMSIGLADVSLQYSNVSVDVKPLHTKAALNSNWLGVAKVFSGMAGGPNQLL
jgi:hypothetical protein